MNFLPMNVNKRRNHEGVWPGFGCALGSISWSWSLWVRCVCVLIALVISANASSQTSQTIKAIAGVPFNLPTRTSRTIFDHGWSTGESIFCWSGNLPGHLVGYSVSPGGYSQTALMDFKYDSILNTSYAAWTVDWGQDTQCSSRSTIRIDSPGTYSLDVYVGPSARIDTYFYDVIVLQPPPLWSILKLIGGDGLADTVFDITDSIVNPVYHSTIDNPGWPYSFQLSGPGGISLGPKTYTPSVIDDGVDHYVSANWGQLGTTGSWTMIGTMDGIQESKGFNVVLHEALAFSSPPATVWVGSSGASLPYSALNKLGAQVSGRNLTLKSSRASEDSINGTLGTATVSSGGPATITSTSGGESTFTLTDEADDAYDMSGNPHPSVQTTVKFVQREKIVVTADPTTVGISSGSSTTVTVHASDPQAGDLDGRVLNVAISGTGVASASKVTTNSSGIATFTVSSPTAGEGVVTVEDPDTYAEDPTTNGAPQGTVTVKFAREEKLSGVATPSAVRADGVSAITLTLSAVDESGLALSGRSLKLTSDGTMTFSPATPVTDASGQALVKVTSTVPGNFNVTVADSDANAIDATTFGDPSIKVPVVFNAVKEVLSATATPTVAWANGRSGIQLTISALDENGKGLSGRVLSLSGGTVSSTNVTTDASGSAVLTLTSLLAGPVTVTITDPDPNVLRTDGNSGSPTCFVLFAFRAEKLLLSASPTTVAADGQSSSTLSIHSAGSDGKGLANRVLSVVSSRGTVAATVTTDANGDAHAGIASSQIGTSTITVTDKDSGVVDTSGSGSPQAQTQVTFVVFPEQLTLTATPSFGAVGLPIQLKVHAVNAQGTALANRTVTFAVIAGAGSETITPASVKTDASGNATANFTSTTAEVVGASVTDLATNVVDISGAGQPTADTVVAFFSYAQVQVTASPKTVDADGVAVSTVQVRETDSFGDPLSGHVLNVTANLGASSAPSVTTDADGKASFTISATQAGQSTVTVTESDGSLTNITGTGLPSGSDQIRFVQREQLSLAASPLTVIADGASTSSLQVTCLDSKGVAIAGRQLNLTSSRGGIDTVTALKPTDASGVATATISSPVPGGTTVTVTDPDPGAASPTTDDPPTASKDLVFKAVHGPTIKSVQTSIPFDGPFYKGITVTNVVTVRLLDWDGSPGHVDFELNGVKRTVTATGNSVSLSYNMGTDLGYTKAYEGLKITAFNSDGVPSEPTIQHWLGYQLGGSLAPANWIEAVAMLFTPDKESFSLTVKWPAKPIGKAAKFPINWGLFQGPLNYGINQTQQSVKLRFDIQPVKYPNSTWQGTAAVEYGKKESFKWDLFSLELTGGASIAPKFQLYPELALQEVKFQPEASIGYKTPDLTYLVPELLPLAPWISLNGKADLTISAPVTFIDGPTGIEIAPSQIDAVLALALAAQNKGWTKFVGDLTIEAGIDGKVTFDLPGNPANLAFFPADFVKQTSVGLFMKGKITLPVANVAWEPSGGWTSGRWTYPTASGNSPKPHSLGLGKFTEPDRPYIHSGEQFNILSPRQSYPLRRVRMETGKDPAVAQGNWDVQENSLIPNAFPRANPVLNYVNGKAIVAYVSDQGSLPANQSTEIFIAQETDKGWKSIPVTNDTALDSQPTIGVDKNGKVILAWTRIPGAIQGELPNARMAKAEIATITFDPVSGAFGPLTILTNDSFGDLNPKFVMGLDNVLYLFWTKSKDNLFLSDPVNPVAQRNDILWSTWSGNAFTTPKVCVKDAFALTGVSGVVNKGNFTLVWTVDKDGDPATNDSAICFSRGTPTTFSAPALIYPDTAPQTSASVAVVALLRPVVIFTREILSPDGGPSTMEIRQSTFSTAWTSPILIATSASVNEVQAINSPNGSIWAVWSGSSEKGIDLWTASNSVQYGAYGLPIRLTDDVAAERQLCAAIGPGNIPTAVYLKRSVVAKTESVTDGSGVSTPIATQAPDLSSLVLLTHRIIPDLTVTEVALQNPKVGAGLSVVATATVQNLRAGQATSTVAFYNGDPAAGGTLLGKVATAPALLYSGQTGTAKLTVTVPRDQGYHRLYAFVDPDNLIAETNETNNVASCDFARMDLSATGPNFNGFSPTGTTILTAQISNIGVGTVSGNVPWQLWKGAAGSGVLLQSGTAAIPALGTSNTLSIPVPTASLGSGRVNMTFVVDPAKTTPDSDWSNNACTHTIVVACDLGLSGTETTFVWTGVGAGTVSGLIHNNGPVNAPAGRLYVFSGNPYLPGSAVVGSTLYTAIPAFGSKSVTVSVSGLKAIKPLWVAVNYSAALLESDYTNNVISLMPVSPLLLTVSPASVIAGHSAVGTITLRNTVNTAGLTVAVQVGSSPACANAPAVVTLPAGRLTALFAVSTQFVDSTTPVTVVAKFNNTVSRSFTVLPISLGGLVTPTTVVGGLSIIATVTLSGPAGPNGAVVKISGTGSALSTPSGQVTVPPGASSVSFPVSTFAVSASVPATLTATFGGVSKTASFNVLPSPVKTLVLKSATVKGGQTANATITLLTKGGAPSGTVISVASSNPAVAAVPASVTVSPGSPTMSFDISTTTVSTNTPVTITAGGISVVLTVTP